MIWEGSPNQDMEEAMMVEEGLAVAEQQHVEEEMLVVAEVEVAEVEAAGVGAVEGEVAGAVAEPEIINNHDLQYIHFFILVQN